VSAWILFDRDCGFCRWSLQRLLAWDRRGALKPLALQDAQAASLLASVAEQARMQSWHLVTADGRVYSAGAAAAPLLRLLPGGRPLARLAEAFPRPTAAGYRFIARHRATLGMLVCRTRRA
jgi:predicted DCC family thiol-disulfide oxidoreductase YuxK